MAVVALLYLSCNIHAQREIRNNGQLWIALFSTTELNDRWAWWNDFHYLDNGGYFLARTGLKYKLSPSTAFTGGYLFGLLPPGGGKTELVRKEHRPWAQVVFTLPLKKDFSLSQRVLYESRFRQQSADGELLDGYLFNHRIRFQTTLRKNFTRWKFGEYIPYATMSNEIYLAFGENAANTFDFNCFVVGGGVRRSSIQYQIGYANRFVQRTATNYVCNHVLALWVTLNFDLKKKQ